MIVDGFVDGRLLVVCLATNCGFGWILIFVYVRWLICVCGWIGVWFEGLALVLGLVGCGFCVFATCLLVVVCGFYLVWVLIMVVVGFSVVFDFCAVVVFGLVLCYFWLFADLGSLVFDWFLLGLIGDFGL